VILTHLSAEPPARLSEVKLETAADRMMIDVDADREVVRS
jgi:hypothetical protein